MSRTDELLNDPVFLRELVMDHYKYPHNHGLIDKKDILSRHMASDSCIDDITVQTDIQNGIIKDVRFDGVACTISTASTSMMSDLLKGKSVDDAKKIIDNYLNMIENKEYDRDLLEEAVAFKNVYKQANRIKCATIGWKAMQEMIEESGNGNE